MERETFLYKASAAVPWELPPAAASSVGFGSVDRGTVSFHQSARRASAQNCCPDACQDDMHDVGAMEDCPTRLPDILRKDIGSEPCSMSVYSSTWSHGQSLVRCMADSCRFSGRGMPWLTESGAMLEWTIDNRTLEFGIRRVNSICFQDSALQLDKRWSGNEVGWFATKLKETLFAGKTRLFRKMVIFALPRQRV